MEKVVKKKSRQQLRNEKFLSLPKAQQRVEIAKDVIKMVKAGKIIAQRGTYFRSSDEVLTKEGADLQKLLCSSKTNTCEVCGIGAAFYSLVRKADRFKLSGNMLNDAWWDDREGIKELSGIGDDDMRKLLRKHFSSKQLTLIETAFETYVAGNDNGYVPSEIDERKAINFGEKFDSSEGRLKAIMQNIIDNKGEFKP